MPKRNKQQINVRIVNNNNDRISLDTKFEDTACSNFFEINIGDLWVTVSLEGREVEVSVHKEANSELEEIFTHKVKREKSENFYKDINFQVKDLKEHFEKNDTNFHEKFNIALIMPKKTKNKKI